MGMANNTSQSFDFAGLSVSVSGDDEYAEKLREYFRRSADNANGAPADLAITVCEDKESLTFEKRYASLSEGIVFNEASCLIKRGRLQYRVDNLFGGGPTALTMFWNAKESARDRLRRTYHTSIGTCVEERTDEDVFIGAVTNYSLLWYVCAITLMKHDRVFVHSGMMTDGQNGILLSGTGGCGKTSTMMELLSRPGWKYLAEDFGVAGSNGVLWSAPKHACVYHTDALHGNDHIAHALAGLPSAEMRSWKRSVRAGNNPRHHFASQELFGADGVAKSAPLTKAAFLSRCYDVEQVTSVSASPEELGQRICAASFRELKELYEILCNIRAVADEDCRSAYPSLDDLQQKYLRILVPALERAECSVLLVPPHAKPADIAEAVAPTR